jgi:cyanophycin synthetase
MRLVEVRDLDGPNLFMLEPAIKIEVEVDSDVELNAAADRLPSSDPEHGSSNPDGNPFQHLLDCSRVFINLVHIRCGLDPVNVTGRRLETPNHVAIVYGWSHRRFALALANQLVSLITGEASDPGIDIAPLVELLQTLESGDRPLMVADADRRIPVVGVTGTNGKTTTTRLLAHILMNAGQRVGWSSTSGVYIDGEEVLQGDYSGPAGARRVLTDSGVETAVLETARGGILLRGLACQSHDVSVFTNVSADHLNLHGVRTVEGLAEVKAVVVRSTRPGGTAVLNADDPLVLASTSDVRAKKLLITCGPANPVVAEHITCGGGALRLEENDIAYYKDHRRATLASVLETPLTFGGRARHMIENAMAGAGAAIGLGLPLEQVADGLKSFQSSASQNLGRLNVYDLSGVTVIMDFAHNEAGLTALLDFAAKLTGTGGRITVLIGTAGDRTDESLREIGRLAGAGADRVIAKRTKKYERGRTNEEMIRLYREGAVAAGKSNVEVAESELDGLHLALDGARPGDVIALMCQEQMAEVIHDLQLAGKPLN